MQIHNSQIAAGSQADTMTWQALTAELDVWQESGRQATFWWRDDDAARPGPQLSWLLSLSQVTGAPIALASVPAYAGREFAETVLACPTAYIVQHGYAHIDHSKGSGDVGASELSRHRPLEIILAELVQGREILSGLFGSDRFLPVVVPPWNRIDPTVTAKLTGCGYIGLSLWDARPDVEAAPGLRLVNTHCDPIKWKGGARFNGTAKTVAYITNHLAARRTSTVDANEPTGLLTHHIDHDRAIRAFCETLLSHLANHPSAQFLSPRDVFET